jgi:predicted ester cyclase
VNAQYNSTQSSELPIEAAMPSPSPSAVKPASQDVAAQAEGPSGARAGLPFTVPHRPQVSHVRHRDVLEMQAPGSTRTQRMRGFDEEFVDIVDYIYRITHRIWVDRALGQIYDYYDHVSTVYTPLGVTRTVEEVVASTAAMINAFPDRESHFLNVAWSGDDEQGFYTSHLGFSRMTNRGPSAYGPATNRTVVIRTVADCISLNNKIHTEWLVRDNGAMVRQLGFDSHQVARELAERPQAEIFVLSVPTRMNGQLVPQKLDLPRETLEQYLRHMFHDVWNCRRLDRIADLYAPDAVAHSGGGRVAIGARNISALAISILTGLPDAVMSVDHVSWSEEPDGLIAAVRWCLQGSTRPGGFLGEVPAGQQVAMMGMSHFRFRGPKIVEEWTLFDEVAVLAQAYRSAASVQV